MEQLLRDLLPLIGVVLGALISYFISRTSIHKQTQLKVIEKLIDKQIESLEQIITISKNLRRVTRSSFLGGNGENFDRYPVVLESHENYNIFHQYFSDTVNMYSTWLPIELTRELFLLQDYMVNLLSVVDQVGENDQLLQQIGNIIRQDFIDFSANIEKLAHQALTDNIVNLKLNSLREWHKFEKQETYRRLEATKLFSQLQKLEEMITQSK